MAARLDDADRTQRVFLRADKTVSYGALVVVMNLLWAAGYLKVALVGLEDVPGSGEMPAPATTGGHPHAP